MEGNKMIKERRLKVNNFDLLIKSLKDDITTLEKKINIILNSEEYKELANLKKVSKDLEEKKNSLSIQLSNITQLFQDAGISLNFEGGITNDKEEK
jgi:hypothetical protein